MMPKCDSLTPFDSIGANHIQYLLVEMADLGDEENAKSISLEVRMANLGDIGEELYKPANMSEAMVDLNGK